MTRTELASLILLSGIILLPMVAMIFAYMMRRLEATERLRAIERGLTITADPVQTLRLGRMYAVLLIGAGLGTIAGALLAATKLGSDMVAGAGLGCIPLGAGVALLFDLRRQEKATTGQAGGERR